MSGFGSIGIYGVLPVHPVKRFPGVKGPDAVLDYSWDMTPDLFDPDTFVNDWPTSIQLTVSPSGAGEVTASRLSLSGLVLTAWFAGGVAGRFYVVNIETTTVSGRTYQWDVGLQMDPTFAAVPLPAPPSTGAGPILSWAGAITLGLVEHGLAVDTVNATTA